ncbi:hypothetical protein [Roseateles sp. MS654]|uniref:hypothetical protein n=1 Tax=Roseateles sp. MS654 TaxID=3412685 RepID=UPI003C2D50D6
MSVNYYALGKTTWQAIRLEDFQGARGAKLDGLSQIGAVYLQTDDVYSEVSQALYGEYRFVFWPRNLLELFMLRFQEENPAGVEYWASDCISVYDEPKEGSFGWINGNHGNPIEYVHFQDMWEIADRYVPELRSPDNMKVIFGEAYEPYMKAMELRNTQRADETPVEKSLISRLKRALGLGS